MFDNRTPGCANFGTMTVEGRIYANDRYIEGAERLGRQMSRAGISTVIRWIGDNTPRVNTGMHWLGAECFRWFDELLFLANAHKAGKEIRLIVADADMLIVGDISELLTMPTTGWALVPDHYDVWQGGISVMDSWAYDWATIYDDLADAITTKVYEKGDQTLLNEYLAWHPEIKITALPKGYSWCREDGAMTLESKILHFHGEVKPWMDGYNHRHPFAGEWNKKQIYE